MGDTTMAAHVCAKPVPAVTADWGVGQTFTNKLGTTTHWREAAQPKQAPKAIVVICHGMSEHSGRYAVIASQLVQLGYAVYALDHKGHGKSSGDRLYAWKFSEYVHDLVQLTGMAKARNPGKQVFLVAHSFGSLVAIHAGLKYPDLYTGIVLSAPPLAVDVPMVCYFACKCLLAHIGLPWEISWRPCWWLAFVCAQNSPRFN